MEPDRMDSTPDEVSERDFGVFPEGFAGKLVPEAIARVSTKG